TFATRASSRSKTQIDGFYIGLGADAVFGFCIDSKPPTTSRTIPSPTPPRPMVRCQSMKYIATPATTPMIPSTASTIPGFMSMGPRHEY
ncbi:MAG TPA: hypothetical protein VFE98_11510, partial [Candidatus Bathyarchaeia archaeon]|nr:hypothetical protein [Candidatus Bathyarchaeia archaeon]